MTAFAASQLQQVIFDLLDGDAALSARLTGVYDAPPHSARPPYLTLGETRLSDSSVKDRCGATIRFEVNLWSLEQSQMDIKELAALVDKVLSGAKPSVPGYELVALRFDGTTIVRQFAEGSSLYKGRMSYSARLFEKA